MHFCYTPDGYAAPDGPGVVMRGQLVGQVLRSRPLFMVARDGANTAWDSLPSEGYHAGRPPGSTTSTDSPWSDVV